MSLSFLPSTTGMYSHTVVFDGFHWPSLIINRIGKLHIGRIELLFKSTGLYLYTRAIQSENLIEHSRKQCTRGRRKNHNVVIQTHEEKLMFQKDTCTMIIETLRDLQR